MIRQVGRLTVGLTRHDGLRLDCLRWWAHAFVWTRGHRRNPVYVRFGSGRG